MKAKVLSIKGKETREIELNKDVFGIAINQNSIYEAIKNELANKRVGTANTKTRSEVKGSRKKPWRQKGTGRARVGKASSPIWVGGGITFGPRRRSYNYKIPKKLKRLAMRSVLSLKLKDNRLKIIEDFNIETGKTKDLLSILKNLIPDERSIIILGDDDKKMLKRAGSNIPWLNFLAFNRLLAHNLYYSKNILLFESAALKLNNMLNDSRKGKV